MTSKELIGEAIGLFYMLWDIDRKLKALAKRWWQACLPRLNRMGKG